MNSYKQCNILPSKSENGKTPILIVISKEVRKIDSRIKKHYIINVCDVKDTECEAKAFIDAIRNRQIV